MKHLILLLLIFTLSLFMVSCGDDSNIDSSESEKVTDDMSDIPRLMMQTGNEYFLTPVSNRSEMNSTPEHMDTESVQSYIFVQPSDSLSVIKQYERGKVLEFSLGEDLNISARINRNQAIGEKIRNLTATILDPYDGVVTLSIDEGSMTGNIDVVSEKRLFHIRYDSLSGKHYIAEIDRTKLDVIEGSEPLEGN